MSQSKLRKFIGFCVVGLLVLGVVVFISASSATNRFSKDLKEICSTYNLENVGVTVNPSTNYSGYTFYRATITCDGFSKLDEASMLNFFVSTNSADGGKKTILSNEDITVNSDGHTYTYESDLGETRNIFVVYCDGSNIATKSNTKSAPSTRPSSNTCPNCGASFRPNTMGANMIQIYGHCNICNGRGRDK